MLSMWILELWPNMFFCEVTVTMTPKFGQFIFEFKWTFELNNLKKSQGFPRYHVHKSGTDGRRMDGCPENTAIAGMVATMLNTLKYWKHKFKEQQHHSTFDEWQIKTIELSPISPRWFTQSKVYYCTVTSLRLSCCVQFFLSLFNRPSVFPHKRSIYPRSQEIATLITMRAVSKSTGSTHHLHNKCQAVMIYVANESD